MIIYVDIDDTICKASPDLDYAKSTPIKERISKINALFDEGHTIIYWTARGTVSGLDWTDVTLEQFKDWGVKYHQLKMKKPAYDLFIDDKNINSERFFADDSLSFYTPKARDSENKRQVEVGLLIGNKPYEKLKLDNLLDSWKTNMRMNMGIPKKNNGTIKDQIAFCDHIWKNFVEQKKSWNEIFKIYGDEFKEEHLSYFCNNFSKDDYNNVVYAKARYAQEYNVFLEKLGCPHRFTKQPRTGVVCIMEMISANIFPVVFGFSITNEIRKTGYINDFVFKKEEEGRTCHSKEEEINVMRWLHSNFVIDATLCMLEDKEEPSIKCNGLEPSKYIENILIDIYGDVKINRSLTQK